MSTIFNNRKYLAINIILFAILYLSITFNKEFIRPVYGSSPIIGIVTGSFANFMAAFIISLFPVSPILSKNVSIKKARIIVYTISFVVFIILTVEEIHPMWGASTHYDFYDILASAFGAVLAIVTFEMIINRRQRRNDKS